MNANLNLISQNVMDRALHGCDSYSFAALYEPDYIDDLFTYFIDKGYRVKYINTSNPNRILIKISWGKEVNKDA